MQEALDENLPSDTDESEWQWQALAAQFSRRYELKLNERDLKKVGREELPAKLIEMADAQVQAVDLKEGEKYLQPDWGLRSVLDWVRLKFGIKLTLDELAGQSEADVIETLKTKVRELYRKGSRISRAGGRQPVSRRQGPAGRRRSPLRSGRFLHLDPPALRTRRGATIRRRFPHPTQEPPARTGHEHQPGPLSQDEPGRNRHETRRGV